MNERQVQWHGSIPPCSLNYLGKLDLRLASGGIGGGHVDLDFFRQWQKISVSVW